MITKIAKVVRMALCRHDFRLMDIEYNKQTKRYGLENLAYRCTKCGKIVWQKMR
jgi:uncharacterized protein with PIN domain